MTVFEFFWSYKWSKTVKNGYKWSKTVKNGYKWSKTVKNVYETAEKAHANGQGR
jgi:hypothetical protein